MIEDWNVVATVRRGHFRDACRTLQQFGRVERTRYYNLVVLKVDDIAHMLETLHDWFQTYPDTKEEIAHVTPVTDTFAFADADEFAQRAAAAVERYVPRLAGKAFFVRMWRHGLKGRLSTHEAEQALGEHLLAALQAGGTPGRINFNDPDAVIGLVTVENRGGAALWTRQQLQRYPFLGLL
jgi:adenylyl- and sulfurtransferase ThiI